MILRALVLGFACAASSAAQDERPAAVVRLPSSGVAFGAEFAFTADVAPGFDDAAFHPLVVDRVANEALDGGRERRRYRARCYAFGDVVLELEPVVTLRVDTSLPDPPGDLEWPGDGWELVRRHSSFWPWGVLLLALAGGGLAWSRARQRLPSGQVGASVTPAGVPVAARLAALALPDASDRAQVVAFHAAVKELVREHVAGCFGIAAAVRTSEELFSLLPEAPAALTTCLGACDAVLFAASRPGDAALAMVRDAALGFVRGTEATG